LAAAIWLGIASFLSPAWGDAAPAGQPVPVEQLVWHTDYRTAMNQATDERKLLFIFFYDSPDDPAVRAFDQKTLSDAQVRARLGQFVLARLPRTAEVTVDGEPVELLKHGAFSEMLGRQGVAVIDLAHREASYYGHVVSTFPFDPGHYYQPWAVRVILDLPPGTLTQRTMIYAVRIHPEGPESTTGSLHDVLAAEAEQHSDHQASITLQGHHNWEGRFHRINARLPSGMLAQEVVAESWPDETLVEACVECVDSWRQSPGHWGAVRARHPLFGYDIRRGRNGIWYATGIFGRH
jgi:hypothetical protein